MASISLSWLAGNIYGLINPPEVCTGGRQAAYAPCADCETATVGARTGMGRAIPIILLTHSLVGERDGRQVVRQATTEIAGFASCRSPMEDSGALTASSRRRGPRSGSF